MEIKLTQLMNNLIWKQFGFTFGVAAHGLVQSLRRSLWPGSINSASTMMEYIAHTFPKLLWKTAFCCSTIESRIAAFRTENSKKFVCRNRRCTLFVDRREYKPKTQSSWIIDATVECCAQCWLSNLNHYQYYGDVDCVYRTLITKLYEHVSRHWN